jgi:hypothetical protein
MVRVSAEGGRHLAQVDLEELTVVDGAIPFLPGADERASSPSRRGDEEWASLVRDRRFGTRLGVRPSSVAKGTADEMAVSPATR